MLFRNLTPFPPLYFESRDQKQQDFGIVVLRGTFDIVNGQRLRLAAQQDGIVFEDEYYGDPAHSSLKIEANLVPFKPRTDVLLTADAQAPRYRPATHWPIGVRFGSVEKSLVVTGPRVWERRLGGFHLSPPQAVQEVPIRYELAYGGTFVDSENQVQSWPENPVGRGFLPRQHREDAAAPQIFCSLADARGLEFGRPVPTAGLGPIAPHWAPRCHRVGSFNEMWRRTRFPDLPDDFDFGFYNSAPAGLTVPGFAQGNEVVELKNLTPAGQLVFGLPGFQLASVLRFHNGAVLPAPVLLDTVHIDLIQLRVHLVWRTVYPVKAGLRALEIRARDARVLADRRA